MDKLLSPCCLEKYAMSQNVCHLQQSSSAFLVHVCKSFNHTSYQKGCILWSWRPSTRITGAWFRCSWKDLQINSAKGVVESKVVRSIFGLCLAHQNKLLLSQLLSYVLVQSMRCLPVAIEVAGPRNTSRTAPEQMKLFESLANGWMTLVAEFDSVLPALGADTAGVWLPSASWQAHRHLCNEILLISARTMEKPICKALQALYQW